MLFMKKKMKSHTSRMKSLTKNLVIDFFLVFFPKDIVLRKLLILFIYFSFFHAFVSCFYFTRFYFLFFFIYCPRQREQEKEKKNGSDSDEERTWLINFTLPAFLTILVCTFLNID